MPRNGAIIFGDLEGKLSALRIECAMCTRAGRYWIARNNCGPIIPRPDTIPSAPGARSLATEGSSPGMKTVVAARKATSCGGRRLSGRSRTAPFSFER